MTEMVCVRKRGDEIRGSRELAGERGEGLELVDDDVLVAVDALEDAARED
jgi:hypothetical protein